MLACRSSDHNPLLISFHKADEIQWNKGRKFRFEASWATHKEYKEVVKQMRDCIQAIQSQVTPAMNQLLEAKYTIEEISIALNQMPPRKALGPDGFKACIFSTKLGNN